MMSENENMRNSHKYQKLFEIIAFLIDIQKNGIFIL